MALIDKKILGSERDAVQVKSVEGVRLTGSVAENKNVFDKFPQLIMDKFNELIESLSALGLDDIAEDLNDRYLKVEVDNLVAEATEGMIRKILVNGTEAPVMNGVATLNVTAEGGGGGVNITALNETMYASKWVGTQYSFSDVYPEGSFNIEIEPSDLCTFEQLDAWGSARICGSATANVCTAKGAVPSIDIPIILKVVTAND